jgi:hypothetical protein
LTKSKRVVLRTSEEDLCIASKMYSMILLYVFFFLTL